MMSPEFAQIIPVSLPSPTGTCRTKVTAGGFRRRRAAASAATSKGRYTHRFSAGGDSTSRRTLSSDRESRTEDRTESSWCSREAMSSVPRLRLSVLPMSSRSTQMSTRLQENSGHFSVEVKSMRLNI